MLVLSRQRDQTIMIGDLIEITVVDVRGDKVRLGITAPLSIPVHRKEVYEAIQNENRAASRVRIDDVTLLEQIVRKPTVAEEAGRGQVDSDAMPADRRGADSHATTPNHRQ